MARTKRGNVARKKRKKILAQTKGFRGGLSKLIRPAKQALLHALSNQYRDRRKRKIQFRQLWIGRIKAGLRSHNLSYSIFIGKLNQSSIQINRKMLAELAVHNPETFEAVVMEANA
jgi:large subunit ribosomal protein L20|tara:strand:+ start:4085 stop:4432 length:348 start_codon:yes stop_codon:yes gene_type:complete